MSYHYKQCVSCSAMSDSSPPGFFVHRFLLCPKNIGVVCHFLLQILMGLLHCWQILYHLSHQGNPIINRATYNTLSIVNAQNNDTLEKFSRCNQELNPHVSFFFFFFDNSSKVYIIGVCVWGGGGRRAGCLFWRTVYLNHLNKFCNTWAALSQASVDYSCL